MFNAADFMVFGLILHISNINAIEHHNDPTSSWKTVQNGISIAFIVAYGVLFAGYLLGQSNPGTINLDTAKYVAMLLATISFLLSFSIFKRISTLSDVR